MTKKIFQTWTFFFLAVQWLFGACQQAYITPDILGYSFRKTENSAENWAIWDLCKPTFCSLMPVIVTHSGLQETIWPLINVWFGISYSYAAWCYFFIWFCRRLLLIILVVSALVKILHYFGFEFSIISRWLPII